MKRFSQVLSFLFLLPFISVAQSNYQPGYVITSKGDTARGFIDYRAWDSNPMDISFKSSITDRDKKTYSLNEISLFNINGQATYKKYTCSISMDITNTLHLAIGRDTSFKTATVFLQVLQLGENLALYSYTDGLKTRFYIGEAPDYLPTELIYRIYQGPYKTVIENTYQKQLFALAIKYNALDDNLNAMFANTNYTKDDILAIVSKINHVSDAEFKKKYATHSKFSWYAGAALNISPTTSSSGSSYTTYGGIPHTSYLPSVSFGADLVPNPIRGNEFRLDFSINPSQFNVSYLSKASPYNQVHFAYNEVRFFLSPQALLNIYNAPNFKFYLGVGVALSYSTFSNVSNSLRTCLNIC